jgi:hypothetical protein
VVVAGTGRLTGRADRQRVVAAGRARHGLDRTRRDDPIGGRLRTAPRCWQRRRATGRWDRSNPYQGAPSAFCFRRNFQNPDRPLHLLPADAEFPGAQPASGGVAVLTSFDLDHQTFTRIGVETRPTKSGRAVRVAIWRSACPDCGQTFNQGHRDAGFVPARATVRRCPACRRGPGKPIRQPGSCNGGSPDHPTMRTSVAIPGQDNPALAGSGPLALPVSCRPDPFDRDPRVRQPQSVLPPLHAGQSQSAPQSRQRAGYAAVIFTDR